MAQWHQSVMLREALEAFSPKGGERFIDATLGDGGHAAALLEASAPKGRLLGIERDPEMAERARKRLAPFGNRVVIVEGSYRDIRSIAEHHRFLGSDGVLFDLGLSSWHLDEAGRGFSFREDTFLDMRFDPKRGGKTASDLLNRSPRRLLVKILSDYGEEHHAERIADAIIAHRPVRTTAMLAQIVSDAKGERKGRIHPATKTFQALRIAVNDELSSLQYALPQAVTVLRPGGVLAVLTYHSLEDRIVKRFFKEASSRNLLRIRTKKPLRPTFSEIRKNPRSRSAHLRVAVRQPSHNVLI
jgi:16S rRNA (cytosine1402-N4)-methyltransferase